MDLLSPSLSMPVPQDVDATDSNTTIAVDLVDETTDFAPSRTLTFAEMGLPDALVVELAQQGITEPFPIQQATIADALAGRDTLGRGRTGSGKTLAFVLPTLARIDSTGFELRRNRPRAVILVPTRELANQVKDVLAPLARSLKLRYTTIYGGVSYNGQIAALRDGVDVVVACPGRFCDLMESGHVILEDVEVTILDEADHMAELGFLEDVKRVLNETPESSQRLLFSATLDRGIDKVVKQYLTDPVTHEVDPESSPVDAMEHHVLHVPQAERVAVITDLCMAPGKSLVFTRTKHGAKRLTEQLIKSGVPAVELQGNLSQAVRAKNLAAFSSGKVETLVATDIAARGIHVDDVALVIHADPPEEHKAFLHRSGRTARAGAAGKVVTMMTDNQRRHVKRLTKEAGISPVFTKAGVGDEFLEELAPGERVSREMPSLDEPRAPRGARSGSSRRGERQSRGFDDSSGRRPRSAPGRRTSSENGSRWSNDRDGRPPRDRDSRPVRDRDDRPARADRDDRAPRSFNGDRDSRPSRDRDDRAPRSFRGDRDSRPSRDRFDRDARPSRDRDDRAPRGRTDRRDDRPSRGSSNDWSPRPKNGGNSRFGGPRAGGPRSGGARRAPSRAR